MSPEIEVYCAVGGAVFLVLAGFYLYIARLGRDLNIQSWSGRAFEATPEQKRVYGGEDPYYQKPEPVKQLAIGGLSKTVELIFSINDRKN